MTPAPSCPSTIGVGVSMVPFCMDKSEWHTPEAAMRTSTSPGCGASISTSVRTSSGCPIAVSTAALDMGRGYRPALRSSRSAAFTA